MAHTCPLIAISFVFAPPRERKCFQTMVTGTNITILVCIIFSGAIVSSASTSPRKLIEARSYDNGWEADMAALDLLAKTLHDEPESTGYIFIYGASRGYRNDVARRTECMKNYMVQRRGIPDERLRVVDGGYRAYTMIELWVAPPGSLAPEPRPTIKRKNVRFKRGGTKYTCNV